MSSNFQGWVENKNQIVEMAFCKNKFMVYNIKNLGNGIERDNLKITGNFYFNGNDSFSYTYSEQNSLIQVRHVKEMYENTIIGYVWHMLKKILIG